MGEFIPSNAKLDAVINGADNFESLREQLKAQLAREGVISRDSESQGYGVKLLPGQRTEPTAQVAVSANQAQATCTRVIYPAGNNRFEIYGASEQELDERERQLRSMFAT
jgi:hypothetical protein